MRSHFCWKCIDFSGDNRTEAVSSFTAVMRDHRQNKRIWQRALMHAALLNFISSPSPHPCLPLTRQHVVSLIVKALFCMQIPAPPSPSLPPSPRLPTPLQFSIKIQTEIDDLNGSHCWVPDHGLPLQQTLKRVWGCGLLSDRELRWPSPLTHLRGSFVFSVIAAPRFKTADVNLSLNLK